MGSQRWDSLVNDNKESCAWVFFGSFRKKKIIRLNLTLSEVENFHWIGQVRFSRGGICNLPINAKFALDRGVKSTFSDY